MHEQMDDDGSLSKLPKKEVSSIKRELYKLEKNLTGISDMEKKPGALFVIDIKREHLALAEAKKLNIPIQVLWGKKGVVGTQFKSVKIWQKYTNKKVYGAEINSDHFIPEESPKQTINHLKKFFLKNVKNNSK